MEPPSTLINKRQEAESTSTERCVGERRLQRRRVADPSRAQAERRRGSSCRGNRTFPSLLDFISRTEKLLWVLLSAQLPRRAGGARLTSEIGSRESARNSHNFGSKNYGECGKGQKSRLLRWYSFEKSKMFPVDVTTSH